MEYLFGLAISSTVSAITNSYTVQNIILPVKKTIKDKFKHFTALKTLIYTSKAEYEQVGNTFIILKSNNNSFIQWFRTEKLQELFTYANSIICTSFYITEYIEDCELNLEYEYIYALRDCLIYKKDYSTDFRQRNDNKDIILLSYLFERTDPEIFLMNNKNKLFWNIKKALYGIHQSGYIFGDIKWDMICIHDNNFKLIVDDSLKGCAPDSLEHEKAFDSCWVSFIMLCNTVITHSNNKLKANHERQDLTQFILDIDPNLCIINTVKYLEGIDIYMSEPNNEMNFLMGNIEDDCCNNEPSQSNVRNDIVEDDTNNIGMSNEEIEFALNHEDIIGYIIQQQQQQQQQ